MKSTTDLWFAAYLIEIKGQKLANFENTSRNRGKFFFDMPAEDWHKYKLEFNSSETSKIKHGQEKLKDLVF